MDTPALASRQTRPLPALGPDVRSGRPAQAEAVARPSREAAADDDGFDFLDVLSMLNPLQYVPVVGSIYRAVTGDTIPTAVREIGSLVVSGLLGGPVGVAISAASTALQKLIGFDADEFAGKVLAGLGLVSEADEGARIAAAEPRGEAAAAPVPWSRSQRAAYGVAVDHALARAQSVRVFPHDEAEHVMRRQLATAAYGRSRLAAASLAGSTPVDLSA